MDVSDHVGLAAHTNPEGIEFHVLKRGSFLTPIGTGDEDLRR